MFIFIWECIRLLPNETYSVSVKYIFDYKVKFLRYTRTYNIRRGMIFFQNSLNDLVSLRFVSQFTYSVSFRFSVYIFCFVSSYFISFRCVLLRFAVFVSASFLTLQEPLLLLHLLNNYLKHLVKVYPISLLCLMVALYTI